VALEVPDDLLDHRLHSSCSLLFSKLFSRALASGSSARVFPKLTDSSDPKLGISGTSISLVSMGSAALTRSSWTSRETTKSSYYPTHQVLKWISRVTRRL